MSECAKCNKSVWVPDGYEFGEDDLCLSCLHQELEDEQKITSIMGKILHNTANALHGGPKENGLWSFHDLAELAAELKSKLDKMEAKDAAKNI